MPVFISYQRTDEQKARNIHTALQQYEVECYLDVMDPLLTNPETALSLLLPQLDRCTHLLALVSEGTVRSWWVPFEIGVATRADKRITSFRVGAPTLPEFLKIWPVLDNESELEKFARRYFQDSATLQKSYRLSEAADKRISSASEFHRALKRDLGQG